MKSEAAVQSEIRLEAPRLGITLWRNNSGSFVNPAGVPVRFGLANDSAKLNMQIKSSDLIGFRPIETGKGIIAQFVAIESKREGWEFRSSPREVAQERFLQLVRAGGGLGAFCSSLEEFRAVVRMW